MSEIDDIRVRAEGGNVIFRSATVLKLLGIIDRLQGEIDKNYSDKALHQRYADLHLHNLRLRLAAYKLIDYRKRTGAPGFQIEKMDDYLRLLQLILDEQNTEAS